MGQKAPDQIGLWPPAARNSDPETSQEGAERVTTSGRRKSQTEATYQLITRYPNLTCNELALRGGLSERQLSRRISDAHRKGWIRPNGTRNCSVTGHRARIWLAPQRRPQS